jgi:hypothetical protein
LSILSIKYIGIFPYNEAHAEKVDGGPTKKSTLLKQYKSFTAEVLGMIL